MFFMKELREAILSQNDWRKPGGGRRDPGPLNQNANNGKILSKKLWFFIFSFF